MKPCCDNPVYNQISKQHFRCQSCSNDHICTETTCEYMDLNNDSSLVCVMTGRCFNQLLCNGYKPHEEPLKFENATTKKTQQTKNSKLTYEEIHDLIDKMNLDEFGVDIPDLGKQIHDLWGEIVTNNLVSYIRRNDKFAVVVASVFSLSSGLCNNKGIYIINGCDINVFNLNKKRKFDNGVQIKMIRYGQRFLRKAFHNKTEIENQINI